MDSKLTLCHSSIISGERKSENNQTSQQVHYQEAPLQNQTPFNDQPNQLQVFEGSVDNTFCKEKKKSIKILK